MWGPERSVRDPDTQRVPNEWNSYWPSDNNSSMRTKESFVNRMEVAILLDSGFGLTSRTCTSSLCCPGNFARESNCTQSASQSWPFIPWQSLRIPVTGHVLYFAGVLRHQGCMCSATHVGEEVMGGLYHFARDVFFPASWNVCFFTTK